MAVEPSASPGPVNDSWQDRGNAPHHHHQVSLQTSPHTTLPSSTHHHARPQPPPLSIARPHPSTPNVLNRPQQLALFFLQAGTPAAASTSLPLTPSALEITLDPPNQVTGTWGRTTSVHERPSAPPESPPIANWCESVREATNQQNGTQCKCQKLSDVSSDTQNLPNITDPRLGWRQPQALDDAQGQSGVSPTKHAGEFESNREAENQQMQP